MTWFIVIQLSFPKLLSSKLLFFVLLCCSNKGLNVTKFSKFNYFPHFSDKTLMKNYVGIIQKEVEVKKNPVFLAMEEISTSNLKFTSK